jgi:hypothetical protein
MSDTFGDFDPDDAWDNEPADPEQTAKRLHELREYLAVSDGQELAAWDALSDEDRAIGQELGARLIDAFVTDPDNAPQELNRAIAFLSGQPEWDDLSAEAQEVGVALVDNILSWLQGQGAMQ